jgi:hypothetical protein
MGGIRTSWGRVHQYLQPAESGSDDNISLFRFNCQIEAPERFTRPQIELLGRLDLELVTGLERLLEPSVGSLFR